MTPFRRLAVLVVALALALAGGATVWLSEAGAAAPSAKATPPGPQPNGVNFTIHPQVDQNFCVENSSVPQNPASDAVMSQCAPRDSQHWTFGAAADGSVVIIGGSEGQCLDFSAKVDSLVSVVPCTFKSAEHFFYTPTGQIESTSGKKCLQTAGAALDAAMYLDKCDSSVKLQIWILGH
jgi:hypothetical protein